MWNYKYNIKNTIYNNIIFPVQYIFNQLISTGVYSTSFKKCVVIPLYKSGDTRYCVNYRPISLSLTLSEIFEEYNIVCCIVNLFTYQIFLYFI